VDDVRIPPAGDGFYAAGKRTTDDQKRLAQLEERYRHELMDDEERQELRDRVVRLRRKLGA
jgi:hypothetical protein